MRDYSQVTPQFWTGETGKKLKEAGPEAVVVALYLMTCPHANMIGLYYLPMLYLAHETGLGEEGATKGLQRAIEAGFCTYEGVSEHVFVHHMVRFQVGDHMSIKDNRCKGVANELEKAPKGALYNAFMKMHAARYHLTADAEIDGKTEAPCKPLASQEQEQEQEQEKAIAQKPARHTTDRFPDFWTIFPNKKGKAQAEATWRRKCLDRIADRIVADVKRRSAEDRQWLDGYIPHGSTYINNRGWEDAIETRRGTGAPAGADFDMRRAV